MKPKKFTTSQLIILITWLTAIVLAYVILNFVFKNASTITTPIATILGAVVTFFSGVTGYVTKWYFKKSETENLPKIQLGVLQSKIELARANPDLKILDTVEVKKTFDNIEKPIENQQQKLYTDTMSTDIGTKI